LSQALVRLKHDGTYDLLLGAAEIGQGCKTTLCQIAAEALDVPIEAISYHNSSTDTNPYDHGTFALRITFMNGNAVLSAVSDLMAKIRNFAAKQLGSDPREIEVTGDGAYARDSGKALGMADLATAATKGGEYLVGTGTYLGCETQEPEPETGKMTYQACVSYSAAIAEVEVDTETGVVEMLKLVHGCENGKVINPVMLKGQVHGMTMMGTGFALTENAHPYYPSMDFAVDNLADYVITLAADSPRTVFGYVEVLHPDGPYGAKGMCDSCEIAPAVVAAIHDAIGIWMKDLPVTPERILRALEGEQGSEGRSHERQ
jgi:CO/xanthine dehydrogenase Mo-binding subunit